MKYHNARISLSAGVLRPVLLAKIAVVLAIWLGTLSYAFVLGITEGTFLCSTWGCRPTFETLSLFHALWLFAFLPPGLLVAFACPPRMAQQLSAVVFILGISIGVYDTIAWAELMAERGIHVQPMEFAQRWGYRLATSVMDLPLLAIPIVAGVAWVIAHVRASRCLSQPRFLSSTVDDFSATGN